MNAVALEPFNTGIRKMLVYQLHQDKQYDQVNAEMEKHLELFPEDDRMREMLAIARAMIHGVSQHELSRAKIGWSPVKHPAKSASNLHPGCIASSAVSENCFRRMERLNASGNPKKLIGKV